MDSPKITHPQLVLALAKSGEAILASLTPFKVHLWHMASNIPGEAAELLDAYVTNSANRDRANIIEECGDIEFYLEGLRSKLELSYRPTDAPSVRETVSYYAGQVVVKSGALFDAIKRHIFYEKPLDIQVIAHAIGDLEAALLELYQVESLTRQGVLDANIAKLSKRYGEKYSDAAAQARVDKVEYIKWTQPQISIDRASKRFAVFNGFFYVNAFNGEFKPYTVAAEAIAEATEWIKAHHDPASGPLPEIEVVYPNITKMTKS